MSSSEIEGISYKVSLIYLYLFLGILVFLHAAFWCSPLEQHIDESQASPQHDPSLRTPRKVALWVCE